jgi:hypothetical protein
MDFYHTDASGLRLAVGGKNQSSIASGLRFGVGVKKSQAVVFGSKLK